MTGKRNSLRNKNIKPLDKMFNGNNFEKDIPDLFSLLTSLPIQKTVKNCFYKIWQYLEWNQCNQIWPNFNTLAIFWTYNGNFLLKELFGNFIFVENGPIFKNNQMAIWSHWLELQTSDVDGHQCDQMKIAKCL